LSGCTGSNDSQTACTAGSKCGPGPGQPDPNDGIVEARSDKPRDTNPNVEASDLSALTLGERTFATKLYAELRKSAAPGDNLFFSPHSIEAAFGMLQAGAQSTTEAEIAQALSFPFEGERLHAAMDKLDLELASRATDGGKGSDDNGFRLKVTN